MNASRPAHAWSRSLALVAALALAAPARGQGGPPPSPVRVDPVRQEEVQSMRRVTGEVRAKRRALVAVREAGLVTELLVREGDRVAAGQVLARLDAARLLDELAVLVAELDQARAAVVQQEAVLARAERDLAAIEELARRDAVNPKELADARSEAAIERARLLGLERAIGVLEAREARLRGRVADMAPTAPFAGVVVARRTEAGQWLGAGDAVVEVVADGELEARVDVPQAYYGPVTASRSAVELEVAGGARVNSASWRVVPLVDSAARTFPLVVDLEAGAGLAPGMSVVAEVPTGERALRTTVSRDGLLRSATGSHVFVARPGEEGAPHSAALVPVEVLFVVGDRAVVQGGLRPGDLVVVEGNERLYPTAPVRPLVPEDGQVAEDGEEGAR